MGRKVPRLCRATLKAVGKMKLAVLARTTPIRKGWVLQKYCSLPVCCRKRPVRLRKGSLVSHSRRHIWTWQSWAVWKAGWGGKVLGLVFLTEIGQPENQGEKLVLEGQCSCSVLLISIIPLLGFRKNKSVKRSFCVHWLEMIKIFRGSRSLVSTLPSNALSRALCCITLGWIFHGNYPLRTSKEFLFPPSKTSNCLFYMIK